MARFLVNANGIKDGTIVCAQPDSHVFGRMEDYENYVAAFGSDEGWRNSFVIVDVPDMTAEEARTVAEPVIAEGTPIPDPEIPGHTKRNITAITRPGMDYAALERRSPPRDTLNTIRKITRDRAAVLAVLA